MGRKGEQREASWRFVAYSYRGVREIPECELIEEPALDEGCPKGTEEPRCRMQ